VSVWGARVAYIEVHQELPEHPKTKKAARLLGVSRVTVIGHLTLLWQWCLGYAEDGDITDFDASDIAEAMQWEGDPDILIAALVDARVGDRAGFLERTPEGRLIVHDWGGLVRKPREGRLPWADWAVIRLIVFRRDEWTCQYCGTRAGPFECDHIHPISRGGTNALTNLVTACIACNRAKYNKTVEEWQQ